MKRDLRVIERLYVEHTGRLGIAFFIVVREQNLTTALGVALIAF
ncbi:MAG: hypothetical protein ACM3SR_15485 [Ignavibacteriales bacterium]